MTPTLNTPEEYFDGRDADGAPIDLPSRALYDGAKKLYSDEPAQFPFENRDVRDVSRDEMIFAIKKETAKDLDHCARVCRAITNHGLAVAGAAPAEPAPELQLPAREPRARVQRPQTEKIEEALKLRGQTDALLAEISSGRDENSMITFKPMSPRDGLVLATRGAALLAKVAREREKVLIEMVDLAFKLNDKEAFLENRAIGVVFGTLLHLDEQFQQLGFGSWMPFRFPDQWLAFCGVLRRVLAANGLIHSEHADTYRKLLDETPPVELPGTIKQRVQESRTPINPARSASSQGAASMDELKFRLEREVWGKAPP
jgi:hypothetical protein